MHNTADCNATGGRLGGGHGEQISWALYKPYRLVEQLTPR